MAIRVTTPTFGGNAAHVSIGGRRYGLPPNSSTRRVRGRRGGHIVYVLVHGRDLHALVAGGELHIPDNLRPLLATRYFGQN